MKHVVIFNGPPGSGKDEACRYLAEECPDYIHKEFKEALYIEVCKHYGITMEELKARYTRELKELPWDKLRGLSIRKAMQYVSEYIIKPYKGKDYFGSQAAKSLVDSVSVFSDGGFIEELVPISEAADKVLVVRLHREGCNFADDTRRYLTDEECTSVGAEVYDLYNDDTLEAFLVTVDNIVSDFVDNE